MSLRYEQYRALKQTRQLLYCMLDPKKMPPTIRGLKEAVSRCLKHFPPLDENGKPLFSNDDFTDDGRMKA